MTAPRTSPSGSATPAASSASSRPAPPASSPSPPDGRRLAVARPDGLHLYDLPTGEEVLFRKAHDRFDALTPDSFATAIAFAPDGKRIATGHADTTILIWD